MRPQQPWSSLLKPSKAKATQFKALPIPVFFGRFSKTQRCVHVEVTYLDIGGCPNCGLYYNTAPSIRGSKKGTIILETTHIHTFMYIFDQRLIGLQAIADLARASWVQLKGPRSSKSPPKGIKSMISGAFLNSGVL